MSSLLFIGCLRFAIEKDLDKLNLQGKELFKMAGEITYLKGTTPGHWPSGNEKEGAYYYVQGGSVATYKKASVLITLPSSIRLRHNTNWGRNAFISLGVDGGAGGAIDIGLRNCSRYGANEGDRSGLDSQTDQGHGWEAYCYQCPAGTSKPEKLHEVFKAPTGVVRAQVEVTPKTSMSIQLFVKWLDGNNQELGSVDKVFSLSRAYDWTVFYRFASLPTNNPNASMSDSTFMLGGTFETARLGSAANVNWGINSTPVTKAWIVNAPKCSVPYQWDVGEQFKIDHWA